MNNTALSAGLLSAGGTCLATTEAERRLLSAGGTYSVTTEAGRRLRNAHMAHMVFVNEEHEKSYYEKLEQERHQAPLSGVLLETVISHQNPCRNEGEEEC